MPKSGRRCQPGGYQIRIAQFRLLPGVEPGVVLFSVQLPLGISIPAGVIASIDSGSDLSVPLLRCLRTGCIAARPLSGQELSSLRAGTAMSLRFVGAPSSEVTVPVSLVGLSDGLDATGWGR